MVCFPPSLKLPVLYQNIRQYLLLIVKRKVNIYIGIESCEQYVVPNLNLYNPNVPSTTL